MLTPLPTSQLHDNFSGQIMEELQEALHKQELSRKTHHHLTIAGLEVRCLQAQFLVMHFVYSLQL